MAQPLGRMSAQKPILDEILAQAGFKGADPTQALLAASLEASVDKALRPEADAKPRS